MCGPPMIADGRAGCQENDRFSCISRPTLHTGRNRFILFQISFSANTADAHPGVSGVSKSKTICHFMMNFDAFLNIFWFYSILAGWSTWQWVFFEFPWNFLFFWHPWHPWVCIRSVCWKWNLKQIEAVPPSVKGTPRQDFFLSRDKGTTGRPVPWKP